MRAAPGRRRVPQTSLGSPSSPPPPRRRGKGMTPVWEFKPLPFSPGPPAGCGGTETYRTPPCVLPGWRPRDPAVGAREPPPPPPPGGGSPARPAREDRDLSAPSNAPPRRPRRSPPCRRDTRAQILARAALGVSGPTPASAPAAYPPQHLSLGVSRSRRPLLRRGQGVPWFPCPGPLRPACCGFCSWG